jgi:hypothetical protein
MSCSALVAGRLLVGLGIGASAIVVPAYLAEIAPAKNRGMVVQMYEVGVGGDARTMVVEFSQPHGRIFRSIPEFYCCSSCKCYQQAGRQAGNQAGALQQYVLPELVESPLIVVV